ncbi:hypothetical protein BON70_08090 [Escherichia coli]|nr:hypothetical protein BON70_08090 [Escherichia coli]
MDEIPQFTQRAIFLQIASGGGVLSIHGVVSVHDFIPGIIPTYRTDRNAPANRTARESRRAAYLANFRTPARFVWLVFTFPTRSASCSGFNATNSGDPFHDPQQFG